MSYISNTDWLVEVTKGNVPGHSIVHKFGRNDAVPNASWELVSLLSGATSFLSAATTVRIAAGGNAADDSAGAGAREVTVVGIDDNLVEVSEAITTAGASESSATTASFWRVYRAFVSSSGTYGAANTAAVTIENSAGGTNLIQIAASEGQSQHGAFTIATATTGYLLSVVVTVDSQLPADIAWYKRETFNDTTAPVQAPRIQRYWDGIGGSFEWLPRSPVKLDALTDIWFEAQGSGAGTEVSVDFEILVVDD